MKKTLTLFLSFALMLALCAGALAAESDFKHMPDYFAVGTYSGSETEIVVPAKLNGEATPLVYSDSLSMNALKEVTSLTFSEGITHISDQNVHSGDNITKVVLPDSLEMLGRRNFYQMDGIAEATVPASVAYVGTDCFSYCKSLNKVTFKGVCPTFGNNVFKNVSADLVVYVPSNQVDEYTAALPEGLNIQSSGKKAAASEKKVSEKDFTFDKETATITGYTGQVGCFTIPAKIDGVEVKAIGKNAFYKNPFITVVTIPEGVESIGATAFCNAKQLSRVNFPSTVKEILKSAFNGAKLDSLTLQEGLEVIGESAFNTAFGLNKPAEIVIPNTVTEIGPKAFYSHKAVRFVIGENVQTVGNEAFAFASNMTEIAILSKNEIAFAGDAFAKCTNKATLTLADGITQDLYQSYVDLMPMLYPDCTVIEPEGMEMPFPALDVMAGMPFFGTWHSVAAFDGTDYYSVDLLGMYIDIVLNPDGTGSLAFEGEGGTGCWYMEEGNAIFAPINEEGGKPSLEEAAPFTMDENERMNIDFGGIIVLFEKEGTTYSVPAIPEKPWPEFSLDNAKAFVGTWEAVTYTMDGETYDAAIVGPMTVVLKDDGTAQMIENGVDSGMELRWYADYGTAYFGPTVNTAAKVCFDGNGNIEVEQEGTIIVMKPYAEPAANPTEGAEELIGEWLDDVGNKLTLTADGAMNLTYASDGWTYEDTWAVVDGAAVVTAGSWEGCPITLENGILTITNGEGIFQIFSVDGDLSAYYGEDAGYAMPEAQPIGAEGEPYFGAWTTDMGGIQMTLTLNPDGTCAMEMFGEAEPGVWAMVDGKANVMGDELYIDEAGQLVMASQGMVFTRSEGAASGEMSDEEVLLALLAAMEQMDSMEGGASGMPEHLQGFVGEWYMCYASTGGLTGDLRSMGISCTLILNADGTGSIDFPNAESGVWYEEDGSVYFGEAGMQMSLVDGGFLQYGSMLGGYMMFSQDKAANWDPNAAAAMTAIPGAAPAVPAPASAPAAPSAGFASLEDRLNKKFVAKTYTSYGMTNDASMLGAEYSVIFRENGTCDFTMGGMLMPNLAWGLNEVSVGLNKMEAFVVNYGAAYNFVPTDYGFDLDYFGTMTLHLELAE